MIGSLPASGGLPFFSPLGSYNKTMAKKKKKANDACAKKVKKRYKVWPSAYASGAVVKCRKVGAKNWGKGKKKKK